MIKIKFTLLVLLSIPLSAETGLYIETALRKKIKKEFLLQNQNFNLNSSFKTIGFGITKVPFPKKNAILPNYLTSFEFAMGFASEKVSSVLEPSDASFFTFKAYKGISFPVFSLLPFVSLSVEAQIETYEFKLLNIESQFFSILGSINLGMLWNFHQSLFLMFRFEYNLVSMDYGFVPEKFQTGNKSYVINDIESYNQGSLFFSLGFLF